MIRLAMLSMVSALTFVGSVEAQAQVNITRWVCFAGGIALTQGSARARMSMACVPRQQPYFVL